MKRSPIKRHAVKRKDADPEYLGWIANKPCIVCFGIDYGINYNRSQINPTEAHHAGDHGLSQRAPDRTAIPLCVGHHRSRTDSAHVLGKNFWDRHGLDRDALIARLNQEYDQHRD